MFTSLDQDQKFERRFAPSFAAGAKTHDAAATIRRRRRPLMVLRGQIFKVEFSSAKSAIKGDRNKKLAAFRGVPKLLMQNLSPQNRISHGEEGGSKKIALGLKILKT